MRAFVLLIIAILAVGISSGNEDGKGDEEQCPKRKMIPPERCLIIAVALNDVRFDDNCQVNGKSFVEALKAAKPVRFKFLAKSIY